MQLVSKGQREAELEEEGVRRKIHIIDKAKDDAEMLEKGFLQEAQSTINTQMERPPVGQIDCKNEDLVFMCIDIDFYIDRPPRKLYNVINI
jgi:hypothetical protein